MKTPLLTVGLVAIVSVMGANAAEYKAAAQLGTCVNGHKTLRDVPILYGYPTRSSKERAQNGEIILGGCNEGERKHWVICSRCELRYDDKFAAWRKNYGYCRAEKARKLLSAAIRNYPLGIHGDLDPSIHVIRWLDKDGVEGEAVDYETKAAVSDIVAEYSRWLPRSIKFSAPTPDASGRPLNEWKWQADGMEFELRFLRVLAEQESCMHLEWHRQKSAEQPGAGQPATKPADKPTVKDQPSPPTSKVVPR